MSCVLLRPAVSLRCPLLCVRRCRSRSRAAARDLLTVTRRACLLEIKKTVLKVECDDDDDDAVKLRLHVLQDGSQELTGEFTLIRISDQCAHVHVVLHLLKALALYF